MFQTTSQYKWYEMMGLHGFSNASYVKRLLKSLSLGRSETSLRHP